MFLWLFLAWLSATHASPRLVSTTPQLTEVLFQLGKGSDVVATPELSDYPEAAKSIPRLGRLFQPSLETAVRSRPDWVLLDAMTPNPIFAHGVETLSIPTLTLDVGSISKLFSESERLMKIIYAQTLSPEVNALRRCWDRSALPAQVSFSVLVWTEPVILVGPATLLSDYFQKLGGRNLLPAHWKTPFPTVSAEWMIQHRPDILFVLEMGHDDVERARKMSRLWWPNAPVRIEPLSGNLFARSSLTPLYHVAHLPEPFAQNGKRLCEARR